MMRAAAAALLAATMLVAPPLAAQVVEPGDFRGEPYNAPVPATLAGAEVVSPDRAIALYRAGAAFLDVYPRRRRPEGLPRGTLWNPPRHDTIPGALWLWDTGYQHLAPAELARLREGVARASGGDLDHPLVIFCRADCWMSWNAARRVVAMGYRRVAWFPDGTDGWLDAGGDALVAAEPVEP